MSILIIRCYLLYSNEYFLYYLAFALLIPSISITSDDSLKPAVSHRTTGNPARSSLTSTISLVVPGIFETMAASRLVSLFKRVLFPAFGGPMIAT